MSHHFNCQFRTIVKQTLMGFWEEDPEFVCKELRYPKRYFSLSLSFPPWISISQTEKLDLVWSQNEDFSSSIPRFASWTLDQRWALKSWAEHVVFVPDGSSFWGKATWNYSLFHKSNWEKHFQGRQNELNCSFLSMWQPLYVAALVQKVLGSWTDLNCLYSVRILMGVV